VIGAFAGVLLDAPAEFAECEHGHAFAVPVMVNVLDERRDGAAELT
jgi:hypothetical protein